MSEATGCPAERRTGKVKFFDERKGYGFIEPAEPTPDGRDVFVHYTGIAGEGYRTLAEDARVEFELHETPKGYEARGVVTVHPVL